MGYFRNIIEQMEGYTPGFQPKSPNAVKLNTNENPWPCSPKVLEAVSGLTAENLRKYPEALGDSFRTDAAGLLGLTKEHIICSNGGDDLLTLCFRAFCDAERPVAIAQPTYSLYPVLAQLQECPCIEIARDSEGSLAELAEINAAFTIVCNPNAPTCDFISVEKIGELANRLTGVLLVDEAYVDFSEDNALRLVGEYDNVIILRSMSKAYSLAGVRFGYGIARPELIAGLMKVKDSYNVDAMAIAAATAAIQDQAYLRSTVEKVKAERIRLSEGLKALGFEVPQSRTNFVLARSVIKEAKAVYEMLVQRDIFVRYFSLPGLKDKLRITVGTPVQNDKLLEALQEIVK